jgi:hypothetical protein
MATGVERRELWVVLLLVVGRVNNRKNKKQMQIPPCAEQMTGVTVVVTPRESCSLSLSLSLSRR